MKRCQKIAELFVLASEAPSPVDKARHQQSLLRSLDRIGRLFANRTEIPSLLGRESREKVYTRINDQSPTLLRFSVARTDAATLEELERHLLSIRPTWTGFAVEVLGPRACALQETVESYMLAQV